MMMGGEEGGRGVAMMMKGCVGRGVAMMLGRGLGGRGTAGVAWCRMEVKSVFLSPSVPQLTH